MKTKPFAVAVKEADTKDEAGATQKATNAGVLVDGPRVEDVDQDARGRIAEAGLRCSSRTILFVKHNPRWRRHLYGELSRVCKQTSK